MVLLGVQETLEDIESRRYPLEAAISQALSGSDSSTILAHIKSALDELHSHIVLEEGTAHGTMDIALGWSYEKPRIEPPALYKVTFNLPGPEAVRSASSADFAGPGGIAVELPRLRRAGAHMSALGATVAQVATAALGAGEVPGGVRDRDLDGDRDIGDMWWRPDVALGIGRYGPYDGWKKLHARLVWLLQDTAGELTQAETTSSSLPTPSRRLNRPPRTLSAHTLTRSPAVAEPDLGEPAP